MGSRPATAGKFKTVRGAESRRRHREKEGKEAALAALHRRHDRDLLVRLQRVVALHKFQPDANQDVAVPFLQTPGCAR